MTAPGNSRRKSSSQTMDSASRWLVGSSRSSKSGWAANARQRATQRLSPPESGPTRESSGGATRPRAVVCVRGGGDAVDAGLQLPAVRAVNVVQQNRQLLVRDVSGFVGAQPLDQVRRARLDVLANGEAAIELKLLRQITDAQSAPPCHLAGIGALMAGQNAQQAGLAGAVSAQQADLLARGDQQGNGFEQSLVAISQGEVVGGQ